TEIPTSSAANLYGFHGHEIDPATGLVYMRNRWYDPDMGRFVTADPLGTWMGRGRIRLRGAIPSTRVIHSGCMQRAGTTTRRSSWL
ncbi:MAG: hypothetical protein K8I65_07660, partial [Thermoanaerobaculia bacterium]|nr:hypothetical protein [Thermoanaerobaculia bacterium]